MHTLSQQGQLLRQSSNFQILKSSNLFGVMHTLSLQGQFFNMMIFIFKFSNHQIFKSFLGGAHAFPTRPIFYYDDLHLHIFKSSNLISSTGLSAQSLPLANTPEKRGNRHILTGIGISIQQHRKKRLPAYICHPSYGRYHPTPSRTRCQPDRCR